MGQSNLENRKEATRRISGNILEKIFVTDESLFFQLFEAIGENSYDSYEEYPNEVGKILKDKIRELLKTGNEWEYDTEKETWKIWFSVTDNYALLKRIPKIIDPYNFEEWYLMSPTNITEIPWVEIDNIEEELNKKTN